MLEKKEILIIEDNEDNSLLAEKILNHYKFQTVVVSNGAEALAYCKDHLPSLILMDLSLPDIDGIEVTRQLRKDERYRAIPIIALTAHALKGIYEITQEAGLNDFLPKPFLPLDLVNMVKKHLD